MLAAKTIVGGVGCAGIKDIATIVVVCAENRPFDGSYGSFPGASPISSRICSKDRTGRTG
jgi:phospholipase C